MDEALDLVALAARVSDGHAVDWAAAERLARSPVERKVVHQLRLVESIGRAHLDASAGALDRTLEGEPDSPARWGGLEIRARLGEGSFGAVFRAWDPQLEREVALKLLRANAAQPGRAEMVLREGRLLARVRHPNVVTVFGAESHDGQVGLWMELVEGQSFESLVREQGPLGAREAALVGIDVCRALAAVHGAGLVHRDVKTANVMREAGGRILLMDFGAGRDTATGDDRVISGTPLYIAPEVWATGQAAPHSDLYSLGVLLYNLVTGSHPVRGASLDEVRGKACRHERDLLRDARPDLPEAFVRVVERALAGKPAERFATAGAMEQALAATLGADAPLPVTAPAARTSRRWRWVVPALAVGLVAAWIAFAPKPRPSDASDPAASGQATAEPAGPVPAAGTLPVAAPAGATARWSVEASLVRLVGKGRTQPLAPGDRVALKDTLALRFEASREVWLYVLNRDERGKAFVLFPLPELALANPLRPGAAHIVPGAAKGAADNPAQGWEITSAGGREELLILASPVRQIELEAELNKLPRATKGALAQAMPAGTQIRLRGIGGLADIDAPPADSVGVDQVFALADRIAGSSEMIEGARAWLRRIELQNP